MALPPALPQAKQDGSCINDGVPFVNLVFWLGWQWKDGKFRKRWIPSCINKDKKAARWKRRRLIDGGCNFQYQSVM